MAEKIRYRYRDLKQGFEFKKVKCPTCGSKHINWTKVVQEKSWNGKVILLAECWSGDTNKPRPRHLFLIELDNLPMVKINKIKERR